MLAAVLAVAAHGGASYAPAVHVPAVPGAAHAPRIRPWMAEPAQPAPEAAQPAPQASLKLGKETEGEHTLVVELPVFGPQGESASQEPGWQDFQDLIQALAFSMALPLLGVGSLLGAASVAWRRATPRSPAEVELAPAVFLVAEEAPPTSSWDQSPAPFDDGVSQAMRKLYDPRAQKRIVFGVFQRDVDPAELADGSAETLAQRAALRAEAATSLTNIDMSERQRRYAVGAGMSVVTVGLAYVLWGQDLSPVAKFAAVLGPTFLSLGFLASGRFGLWNIAQAAVWDVDGTGLRAIEDRGVAAALRAKVGRFNLATGAAATALAAAYGLAAAFIA